MENKVKTKPSTISNLANTGMNLSEKLGKAVTEWFTGKPLTEEQKIKKERIKQLKAIQEEAQYQRDLELARRGEYILPEPKEIKKKKEENMFSNLGKHNPLEDFNQQKSFGSTLGADSYSAGGIGTKKVNNEDLEIGIFTNNHLGENRRRR